MCTQQFSYSGTVIFSLFYLVGDVVSAIVSNLVLHQKGANKFPDIPRPPMQSRSWKILNMGNEPYSKLKDGSMYFSKVACKLKF